MNPTKFFDHGANKTLGVIEVGTSRETCLELISCIAREVGVNAAFLYYSIAEEMKLLKRKKNVYGEEIGIEGFISLPAHDLEELTSLSRKQQETAIDRLVKAGYIEVRKIGMPMRKCFRILR